MMKRLNAHTRTRWVLFLLVMTALTVACLEDTPPELQSPVVTVPVPTNLSAVTGADQIVLSWDSDPSFTYSGFVVYRSEDETNFFKIGTPTASPFTDTGVRTNVIYNYTVSGVSTDNIEGVQSAPIAVRAGAFAVAVDGTNTFTNTRDVELTFSAPPETVLLRASEDSTMNNVLWLNFEDKIDFSLSTGDELKTVFAQFSSIEGFESEVVWDQITLDTRAAISSGSFTPTTNIAPGSTVHFTVTTVDNETAGLVRITISGFGSFLARDDGIAGDPTPGDGLYEEDFVVPTELRALDFAVGATFQDAALNESAPFEFQSFFTVTDPPDSVTLFQPDVITTSSIAVRWTQSVEQFFARYELYRDESPSVSRFISPRIYADGDAFDVDFTDSGLGEGITYYYVIYVVNDLEEFRASNVLSATTADIPPTPVVVDSVTAVGADRLTLTWTQNNDTDFEKYEVRRSNTPGVDVSSTLVTSIMDRFMNFYDDTGLNTASQSYYYRIFVFDQAGNSARSNEVSWEP